MQARVASGIGGWAAVLAAVVVAAACGSPTPIQPPAGQVIAPRQAASTSPAPPAPAADLLVLALPPAEPQAGSSAAHVGPLAGEAWNPTPRPSPVEPGWIDVPVRSRDVLCAETVTGHETTDYDEVRTEHLTCAVAMTDARVAGALTADLTVTFAPGSSGAGTWVGDFRLVNGLGTWTGTGRGAAARDIDEDAGLDLYGAVVYRGLGAYAGLACTLLLAGESTPSTFSGWISGASPTDPWLRLADSR